MRNVAKFMTELVVTASHQTKEILTLPAVWNVQTTRTAQQIELVSGTSVWTLVQEPVVKMLSAQFTTTYRHVHVHTASKEILSITAAPFLLEV